MARLDLVDQTLTKLATCAGISSECARAFRIVAFTVVVRDQVAYVGAQRHGSEVCRWDHDNEMVSAGLVTLGKWEPNRHPMALSHDGSQRVTLTPRGEEIARRTVAYETSIRERHMSPEDFETWKKQARSV